MFELVQRYHDPPDHDQSILAGQCGEAVIAKACIVPAARITRGLQSPGLSIQHL